MSKRMIRRLDLITAYVRWLALIGIPVVAFILPSTDLELAPLLFLFIALCKAVVDTIPVVMLAFKFYPEQAALAFAILDTLFSLAVLYLGGSSMFFYAFVPAIAMSVRFEWVVGLGDAIVLTLGHVIIALIKSSFRGGWGVLGPVLLQAFILLGVSVFSGLLAENIKREPPLDDEEQKAQGAKLARLQAAADRARAVYEMASTLSATLNREKILNAVLEISALGFDELTTTSVSHRDRPAGAVFLYGEDGLFISESRNIGYEELGQAVSENRGVLGQVVQGGEPLLLAGLADDPELSRFTPFRRCRSAICVPLRAGFEVYGVIVFASPVPGTFTEAHVELLSAVANQAVVALENAQLYQDLQAEKEHIIEVEEEARAKLARDLHDGPTQSISAIAMRLNFSRLLLDRDPQRVKEELFKLENLARRTTKEIRTMLFTLRPVVLETQGLKVAVEQLVDKLQETGELPVTLEIEAVEDQIDVNIKTVAWFITEECLNNAKKYAAADNIWVRMYIREGHFVAEIEDDGEGFAIEETLASYEQRGSFGLLNLQERADLVNGRMMMQSELGKGSKFTLVVPLQREAV
jgi:signal transduction histidine kinase